MNHQLLHAWTVSSLYQCSACGNISWCVLVVPPRWSLSNQGECHINLRVVFMKFNAEFVHQLSVMVYWCTCNRSLWCLGKTKFTAWKWKENKETIMQKSSESLGTCSVWCNLLPCIQGIDSKHWPNWMWCGSVISEAQGRTRYPMSIKCVNLWNI